jgi:prophage regulatory protein
MSKRVDRLIPGPDADAICGTTRSVRYRLLAEGKFPKPIKIGTATRFSERECREWVAARISERDKGGKS